MGGILTKTPLERRNTVIKRSQRKSIHLIKSKITILLKDIQQFDGNNSNDQIYQQLHERIEQIRKEFDIKCRDLQPQLRNLYNDTNKKLEDCIVFLNNQLEENQKRNEDKQQIRESVIVEEAEEEDADNAEEVNQNLEQTPNKRQTVELHVVQIDTPDDQKPTKRSSLMKVGIPVLPGAIMNSWFKKSKNPHEIIIDTRKELEMIELEISRFVGERNGKIYMKIKQQLDNCKQRIDFNTNDETIQEQAKLCDNYINSCFTFLDEKATVIHNNNNSDGEDVTDDVFEPDHKHGSNDGSLSPKFTKTTTV